MNGLLDRIREHARPEFVRRLEVPEWGEPAQIDANNVQVTAARPLVITYKMVTLDELSAVQEMDGSDWHKQAARIVAMKALDENGNRLFKTIDAVALRETAAPDVVTRIAISILGRLSIEDAAKN